MNRKEHITIENIVRERLKTYTLPLSLLFNKMAQTDEAGQLCRITPEDFVHFCEGDAGLALGDTVVAELSMAVEGEKKSFVIEKMVETVDLELLKRATVSLTMEFPSLHLPLGETEKIREGSIIETDYAYTAPLQCVCNDKLIGEGRVISVDENYGLYFSNINFPHTDFAKQNRVTPYPSTQARFKLAETSISIYDLLSLQEGMALDFSAPVSAPVTITCGEKQYLATLIVDEKEKVLFRVIKVITPAYKEKAREAEKQSSEVKENSSLLLKDKETRQILVRLNTVEDELKKISESGSASSEIVAALERRCADLESSLKEIKDGVPEYTQENNTTEWKIENRNDLVRFARKKPEELFEIIRSIMFYELAEGEISGKILAVIIILLLPDDVATHVLRYARRDEQENLLFEIARCESISPEDSDEAIKTVNKLTGRKAFFGGIERGRELFESTFGTEYTTDLVETLTASLQVRPFDFIRRCDPSHVYNFLLGEHPQTIALVLSYLDPQKSAMLISVMPDPLQPDLARRIAIIDRVSPEIIREVERVLERKLSQLASEDYVSSGGIDAIVEILNNVDRGTEVKIMYSMDEDDPELAEEIKKRMFVFEDIVLLDDLSLQKVFDETNNDDIARSLKGVDTQVQYKVFRTVGETRAQEIQIIMDEMGPMRLRDVEESQQIIVNIIRHLEDRGEIIAARGGEEEIVV